MYLKKSVQHTVNGAVAFKGKGVHSNKVVSVTVQPSPANTGIYFVRQDAQGSDVEIAATYEAVGATDLCTLIGDPKGVYVATIEHLMAALRALGVDNARIEIDGCEVPVMDGSSHEFVAGIVEAGLMPQTAPRRYIRIEKPVRVDMGASFGELTPYEGCYFDVEIDFDNPIIGRQRFAAEITADNFVADIASARTFGFMSDVEKLWKAGYALGSSLENSVVIGNAGIINPDGLRFRDEFVRHKLLDAVGDLALSGAPILGAYKSYRGGHKLNFMVLKALFENRDAWSFFHESARSVAGAAGHGDQPTGSQALISAR